MATKLTAIQFHKHLITEKVQVGVFIYSLVVKPLRRSGVGHTVLPANNTMPAFTS